MARAAQFNFARGAHIWAPAFISNVWRTSGRASPRHVWVMIGDHYEPLWNQATEATAAARVKRWTDAWPAIAKRHKDSLGRMAQYTFFYPEEEYRPAYLDALADMARSGCGDVEIHLHHDGEDESSFVARMSRFRDVLHEQHGLLRLVEGRLTFGFIHGNWALDNSRPDGRYCGLNNELILLRDLGCYADFTLPSAPSLTQTSTINTIYWAIDDPRSPKSHDTGIAVESGRAGSGDLLMIPGPLAVRFAQDGRLAPRLETGELASQDPPTAARVRIWVRHAPRIGDCVFIKLFAHGAQERHAEALLGEHLDALFTFLEDEARASGFQLHYASAWEMYQEVIRRAAGGI